MISRVILDNWRAYDHLDVRLKAGTTFVVARNGIGKTSLIEGAKWALFGEAGGRPENAVRLGATSASARVELRLAGGETVGISRQLLSRPSKSRPDSASATLDGRSLTERELESTIRGAFQAELAFLARVTMLRREELDKDASQLNLQQHLCRFLGIDSLQETLDQLRANRRAIEAEVRTIKQIVGVTPKHLRELRNQHDDAIRSVGEGEMLHKEAQQSASLAAQVVRDAEDHASWMKSEKDRVAAIAALAEEASMTLGLRLEAEELKGTLDRLEAESNDELVQIGQRQGFLEGRIRAVQNGLAQLTAESGICPVCHRPLSFEDVTKARSEHERDLDRLRNEAAALAGNTVIGRLEFVRSCQRRLNRLVATQAPSRPAHEIDDARVRFSESKRLLDEVADRLAHQRAIAIAASTAVAKAESDLRTNQMLERRFYEMGLSSAAIDALATTIDKVLDGTIDPLARQVAERWKRLFGDRGPLQVSGQGSLSRDLQGESLPFAAFSTGEKMGAQLILRLMILNTATKATFCWVDEPLEHLDPDARRRVASMLAMTPETTGMEQVLVTTYEEPLARRLANRMPAKVDLLYVRAGGSTAN